jgi:3-methylcrotonyl-CoA carboxylase alpha subunit
MIHKLLIANRGEIACRIARTAAEMGIETLAIASDADAQAMHVLACDDVVCLGGNTPAESYLRGADIIAAGRARGANAIHPGYGFLSEDPEFAQAVIDAGLIWVGPPPSAIRAMGLKDSAKVLMQAAKVPVVPGYHEADQSLDVLQQAAQDIGYPVLIKAVAGGGGKGMRLVEQAHDFAAHLASAQSEARNAFGNDHVLVEKFISNPRHIEIQVFGDGETSVHLYERDCSLQRRHQKIVEEAPAPYMPDAVRDAMGRAAVRAAEAIGYSSAGTVEFIVDGSEPLTADSFFFMEMNTRLQVEHPVTEEILGLDLVAWQLRVAAGELLPKQQSEIVAQGHSIEVRLYAEDPQVEFLPSIGRLHQLAFGPGLRVEAGVETGGVVSPFYDPMIAKLIATGPDRATALQRLLRGLRLTQIVGVKTNRDFLLALLQHPEFVSGHFDTGLIGRDLLSLTDVMAPSPEDWALAALAAMDLPAPGPEVALQGFALFTPLRQQVILSCQDETNHIQVSLNGPHASAVVEAEAVSLLRGAKGWCVVGSPQTTAIFAARKAYVFAAQTFVFECLNPLDRTALVKSDGAIFSPMPGLVKQVLVSNGQDVVEGDPIVVLEAMKMQHTLRAAEAGQVQQLTVRENTQVDAGKVMAVIIPSEKGE